jgi:hypothetical protein
MERSTFDAILIRFTRLRGVRMNLVQELLKNPLTEFRRRIGKYIAQCIDRIL